jgi:hypothetical protein
MASLLSTKLLRHDGEKTSSSINDAGEKLVQKNKIRTLSFTYKTQLK